MSHRRRRGHVSVIKICRSVKLGEGRGLIVRVWILGGVMAQPISVLGRNLPGFVREMNVPSSGATGHGRCLALSVNEVQPDAPLAFPGRFPAIQAIRKPLVAFQVTFPTCQATRANSFRLVASIVWNHHRTGSGAILRGHVFLTARVLRAAQ